MLHLLDRAETDLTYDKQITLKDLETGEQLQIDPGDIRDVYKREVQSYLDQIRKTFDYSVLSEYRATAVWLCSLARYSERERLGELLGRRGI